MQPPPDAYKKRPDNPRWRWLTAIAYGLFVLLFAIVKPTHINAILSLWAIPLIFIGLIKYLIIIDERHFDNYDRLKLFVRGSHSILSSLIFRKYRYRRIANNLKETIKDIFFSLNFVNKVSFTYLFLSLLTIIIAHYWNFIEINILADNYILLVLLLIFSIYFLYGLSVRISEKCRGFIKKSVFKKFLKHYYPQFNSNIYSDEQLLAWVKQTIEHYHKIENKTLANNVIFAIGENAEDDYFDKKYKSGRVFQDVLLYKVHDGTLYQMRKQTCMMVKFSIPCCTLTIHYLEMLALAKRVSYDNKWRCCIEHENLEQAFIDLQYDYEKASLLQWQIFLSSKLPKWVTIL